MPTYNKEARAREAVAHTEQMEKEFHEDILNSIYTSQIYSPKDNLNYDIRRSEKAKIKLVCCDSIEAILKYSTLDRNAVLNFASYKTPGGGYIVGSKAQEESLCEESYLYNVLRAFSNYYARNNENKNRALYKNRAIYSYNIRFARGNNYKYCDVITCAAPNISPSRKYGWGITDAENTEALESRINFILSIAAQHRVNNLILGAYGCGVFGQDATEVAQIFKKFLDNEFKYCFENVIFAIPSGENYDKFNKVLN